MVVQPKQAPGSNCACSSVIPASPSSPNFHAYTPRSYTSVPCVASCANGRVSLRLSDCYLSESCVCMPVVVNYYPVPLECSGCILACDVGRHNR